MSAPVPPPVSPTGAPRNARTAPLRSQRLRRRIAPPVVLLMLVLGAAGPWGARRPVAGQEPPTVTLSGQIGGLALDVAVVAAGSADGAASLRVAVGPRVLALDVGTTAGADGAPPVTTTATSPLLPGLVRAVAVAEDGRTVVVGDAFGVAVWDGSSDVLRRTLDAFDGRAVTVIGARAVVATREGEIRVVDLADDGGGAPDATLAVATAAPAVARGTAENVVAAARVGDTWWVAVQASDELPVAWLVPIALVGAESPSPGAPVPLEALVQDVSATADGGLLVLQERLGLARWDVSDPAAPIAGARLSPEGLDAPLRGVVADRDDPQTAWLLGGFAGVLDGDGNSGTGRVWRMALPEPGDSAAPSVAAVVATDRIADRGVALGGGLLWALHGDTALSAVRTTDGAPPSGNAPTRIGSAWASVGLVRGTAARPDGRVAVAAGPAGVWLLADQGAAGYAVVDGPWSVGGEADAVAWDAEGRLWVSMQRPGAVQVLELPSTPGDDPVSLGRLEGLGTPVDLALDEERRLLYVADAETGLWIANADPAAPTLIAEAAELTEAWAIVPDVDRVWVAGGDRGIYWIDTLNPAATRSVYSANTPGTAFGLARFGSHLLVADLEGGLQTIRTLAGRPMAGGSLALGQVVDVAAVGSFGYAAVTGVGVFEFDAQDIRVLTARRAVRVPGLVRRLESIEARVGGRLLATAGTGGLSWLAVQAPPGLPTQTPRPTATATPTPPPPAFIPWAGTGREETPLRLKDRAMFTAEELGGRALGGVALRGARAVLGLANVRGGPRAGLALLALDEVPPRLFGRHEGLDVAPRDLLFDGALVAVAAWTDGLQLVSVDSLGRFTTAGSLSMTLRAGAVAQGEEGTLYVGGTRLDAGPRGGLLAVDVADSSAPLALAEARLPDAGAMAYSDGALFVLDYTAGLRVFDARTVGALTEAVTIPAPGAADIAAHVASDGRVRVALAVRSDGGAVDGGLVLLDTTDPLSPTVAGRWARSGDEPGALARFVALTEAEIPGLGDDGGSGDARRDRTVAARVAQAEARVVAWITGERTLFALDVTDIAAPRLLAELRMPAGGLTGLAADGARAIVLHRTRGAIIVDLMAR